MHLTQGDSVIYLENDLDECIIARDERVNKYYMKQRRKVVIDLIQKKISNMKKKTIVECTWRTQKILVNFNERFLTDHSRIRKLSTGDSFAKKVCNVLTLHIIWAVAVGFFQSKKNTSPFLSGIFKFSL